MNYLELIKTPRKFFISVKKETALVTVKKVTLPLIVFTIVSTILANYSLAYLKKYFPDPALTLTTQIIYSIVMLAVYLVITTIIINISLNLVNVKSKMYQSFKGLAYPMVLMMALLIIVQFVSLITPILLARFMIYVFISIVTLLWSAILLIISMSEYNKIPISKSTIAYLISLAIFTTLYVILIMAAG